MKRYIGQGLEPSESLKAGMVAHGSSDSSMWKPFKKGPRSSPVFPLEHHHIIMTDEATGHWQLNSISSPSPHPGGRVWYGVVVGWYR